MNQNYYPMKLQGARTAFFADDFLNATALSYSLLRDRSAPFWARAQASLIIVAYDAYPSSNQNSYITAMGIVETIRGMDQEQVDPNYKTLQLSIEGKPGQEQVGNVLPGESSTTKPSSVEQSQTEANLSLEENSRTKPSSIGQSQVEVGNVSPAENIRTGPSSMEQSQIEEAMVSGGLSEVVAMDEGIELRKLDRAQLDGAGVASEETDRKDDEGAVRDEEGGGSKAVVEKKIRASRDCCCIVL